MAIDENFKRLIEELGQAINESLESDQIAEVIRRIRATGYDIFLVLEVTVGFNQQGDTKLVRRKKRAAEVPPETKFRFTRQDAEFLRELRISVDDEKQ